MGGKAISTDEYNISVSTNSITNIRPVAASRVPGTEASDVALD